MADIRAQFEDGTEHIYQGVPDDATPDQVQARVEKDFPDRALKHLAREAGQKIDTEGAGRTGPTAQQIEKSTKPAPSPHSLQMGADIYSSRRPMMETAKEGATALGRGAVGLGEVALTAASGAVGSEAGGQAGIGQGIKNVAQGDETNMPAGARTRQVQQAMTYQPRTEAGQAIAGAVSKPFEMANAALGAGGEALGGLVGPKAAAAGRTIGENAIDMAGTMYGGAGALKGIKAARAAGAPRLEQKMASIKEAMDAGYQPAPHEVNPSLVNKAGAAVARPSNVESIIAGNNAKTSTALVKQELGLPPDAYLDAPTIKTLRDSAKNTQSTLRSNTALVDTAEPSFTTALADVDSRLHGLKETFPTIARDNGLEIWRDALTNPSQPVTVGVALRAVDKLRSESKQMLKAAQIGTVEAGAGMARRGVADAVERLVYDTIQDPAERAAFIASREKLAKLHDIETVTNPKTGHIDVEKLSAMQDAGVPLSGNLKKIADAHKTMPKVVKNVENVDTALHPQASDMGMAHIVAGGLTAGAAPAAVRGVMASPKYGKLMARAPKSKIPASQTTGAISGPAVAASLGAAVDTLPPKMEPQQ